MNNDDVWLKTDVEKLRSLIADEAKMMPMLRQHAGNNQTIKSKANIPSCTAQSITRR
jgi:hypothetical protein